MCVCGILCVCVSVCMRERMGNSYRNTCDTSNLHTNGLLTYILGHYWGFIMCPGELCPSNYLNLYFKLRKKKTSLLFLHAYKICCFSVWYLLRFIMWTYFFTLYWAFFIWLGSHKRERKAIFLSYIKLHFLKSAYIFRSFEFYCWSRKFCVTCISMFSIFYIIFKKYFLLAVN